MLTFAIEIKIFEVDFAAIEIFEMDIAAIEIDQIGIARYTITGWCISADVSSPIFAT